MVVTAEASILHGPQKSSRYGQTISIDLGVKEGNLPVSRTNRMPRASVVVTTAAREIIRLSKDGQKAESIVVVGSLAEPTSHPSFLEITENLRDLRNKWYSKAKLILLTDEPMVSEYPVRRAMEIYDRTVVRMEWGTAKLFAAMTGRKTTELTALAKGLTSLDKIVLRATFQRGKHDNSVDSEFKQWIKRATELRPIELQLSNLYEKVTGQKAITASRWKQILEEATEKLGVPIQEITGPDPLIA